MKHEQLKISDLQLNNRIARRRYRAKAVRGSNFSALWCRAQFIHAIRAGCLLNAPRRCQATNGTFTLTFRQEETDPVSANATRYEALATFLRVLTGASVGAPTESTRLMILYQWRMNATVQTIHSFSETSGFTSGPP